MDQVWPSLMLRCCGGIRCLLCASQPQARSSSSTPRRKSFMNCGSALRYAMSGGSSVNAVPLLLVWQKEGGREGERKRAGVCLFGIFPLNIILKRVRILPAKRHMCSREQGEDGIDLVDGKHMPVVVRMVNRVKVFPVREGNAMGWEVW